MSNRLADETSPYLRQHADNPVDWHPWGEEALTLARRSGKPILLSIGYSACHWCHVMAHESFEDAAVAAVMNRLFVNIKVDREERPDLDQIYQLAHQMLVRQAGGWPLTAFLSPTGEPFFSGTYFPREPRYRLPGFIEVCEWAARLWQERRGEIDAQGQRLREALAATAPPAGGLTEDLDARPLRLLLQSLRQSHDGEFGGFGGAPKFPHQADLSLMLQFPATRAQALDSLRKMARGGLYDQIGGGFYRYSVDERWEIPHFEKMLYDNGLLLGLYAEAWALTREALFARVVEETVAWVRREMQSPGGAYYSSLDADAEGHEGKFYVWTPQEVRDLLSVDEWRIAEKCWGLDAAPNFEGRFWHLKLACAPAQEDAALYASARHKLFVARERRRRPARDEKLLTGWNALMIAGMARAARIFGRREWLEYARGALACVQSALRAPDAAHKGRLLATCKDGRAHLSAYLDDYAFMLAAVLELMQAEFRREDLRFAQDMAEVLLRDFEDRERGGFFFTGHEHEALIQRPKPGQENPLPAGNGMAALCLQRLGHMLGEPAYLTAAERTLALFSTQFFDRPQGFACMMQALSEWLLPPSIVILRGPAERLPEWQLALAQQALPAAVVLAIPNEVGDLPETLDMRASASPAAWVCSGTTCRPPLSDLERLQKLLGEDGMQERARCLE